MLEMEAIVLEMELIELEMLEAYQDYSSFSFLFLLRSLLGGSLPQFAVRS
jgi:hypothetical protein